jgi:hypothetical protein
MAHEDRSLFQKLHQIEPQAHLVPGRVLRRMIRQKLDMDHTGWRAPHDLVKEFSKKEILSLVAPIELELHESDLTETNILIPYPKEDSEESAEEQIQRLLFHAKLDRILSRENLDRYPKEWGELFISEAQLILEEEYRIPEGADQKTIVQETIAYMLEIYFARPMQTAKFFPGLAELSEQITHWVEKWNLHELWSNSALSQPRPEAIEVLQSLAVAPIPEPAQSAHDGNDVRRLVELMMAGQVAESERQLRTLADRLVAATGYSDSTEWYWALRPFVELASAGGWVVGRRLLYDLQKVCVDTERRLFAVDLVEFLITLGKQPIKRELTHPRLFDAVSHLQAAANKLDVLEVKQTDEARLADLLYRARQHLENQARQKCRPILLATLDQAGIVPQNTVEEVARDRIVEELLDVACEKGVIRLGDLRDAIARNRLKLNDLKNPVEWLAGDALLRTNRRLALSLDGVYRRGEIYMRWLHRGCSIFFGTRTGRFLSQYLLAPLIFSYIFVEGVGHASEAFVSAVKLFSGEAKVEKALALTPIYGAIQESQKKVDPFPWVSFVAIAVYIFMLLHWKKFREQNISLGKYLLFDLPKMIINSEIVRLIYQNRIVKIFRRYLLVPILVGFGVIILVRIIDIIFDVVEVDWNYLFLLGSATTFVTFVAIRTTLGRMLEDRVNEAIARAWRIFSVNFVLGLFNTLMNFFRIVLERIDRAFYIVDEWLRFREGDAKKGIVLKGIISVIWFLFTYLFRFAWNLLVEPQINPIKHFPVVTVSHKMLLPLIPSFSKQFNVSEGVVTTVVSGIPGIFGFLAWELKENWRLYRANDATHLRPVAIGSHGETTRGLLRPGFHSGTVPKTYAKLRRAIWQKKYLKAKKIEHHLHHTEEAIERLTNRELCALLAKSPYWTFPLKVHHVHLATNWLSISLMAEGVSGEFKIVYQLIDDQIYAQFENIAWLDQIPSLQRDLFHRALLGFHHLARVDRLKGDEKHELELIDWQLWSEFWEKACQKPNHIHESKTP